MAAGSSPAGRAIPSSARERKTVVHCRDGKTDIIAANKPAIADSVQGRIRLGAEAFLAPKIVVCEGATEAGLLRGLEDYWIARNKNSFAYQGIALFDANGANTINEISTFLSSPCRVDC